MKRLIIQFAASTALFAAAAHAAPIQSQDHGAAAPSNGIVLAQAAGSGSSSGGTGAGPINPDDPLKHASPSTPPAGASEGAGVDSQGMPDSNNAGSGGTNGDSGPLDPRRTPPNAPVTSPRS